MKLTKEQLFELRNYSRLLVHLNEDDIRLLNNPNDPSYSWFGKYVDYDLKLKEEEKNSIVVRLLLILRNKFKDDDPMYTLVANDLIWEVSKIYNIK